MIYIVNFFTNRYKKITVHESGHVYGYGNSYNSLLDVRL